MRQDAVDIWQSDLLTSSREEYMGSKDGVFGTCTAFLVLFLLGTGFFFFMFHRMDCEEARSFIREDNAPAYKERQVYLESKQFIRNTLFLSFMQCLFAPFGAASLLKDFAYNSPNYHGSFVTFVVFQTITAVITFILVGIEYRRPLG